MHKGPFPLAWHIGLAGAAAAHAKDAKLAINMLHGMRLYQDFVRPQKCLLPPVLWTKGVARLLYYETQNPKVALFCVPSLINGWSILDVAKERSLARFLAQNGIVPYILDWGDLTHDPATRSLSITGLIEHILAPAITVAAHHARPLTLLGAGHCMGGTLLMDAASRPHIARYLSGLAFIASPWDFYAGTEPLRALANHFLSPTLAIIARRGYVPTMGLQAFFASLDPYLTARKFARFAALSQDSAAAHLFVAIEDWLNDGHALPGAVAREILETWYGANAPTGQPQNWLCPALVIASSADRLVTAESAGALAKALPYVRLIDPKCGHISMISGARAIEDVWHPLAAWIKNPH